ncbi:PAS domain S-box protein [Siculibacillus lacustris]|uniref:histidine kinase n=1 Tax=Siculibacillus lacustris TaxID=1549641 RepID=A0A4Q9VK49_9HYPH|nr:PAS domain S-box protein [Siculibacillus lacustris]TBW34849.1 PAS domain S-box protein [Siculibacillus lacustris]
MKTDPANADLRDERPFSGRWAWLAEALAAARWVCAPPAIAYPLAAGITGMAIAGRFWMGNPAPPFITLYPAMVFVALFCGLRAGLLATAVGTLTAVWLFVEPYGSFAVARPIDRLAIALFVTTGLTTSLLAGVDRIAVDRGRRRAARALAESEAHHRTIVATLNEGVMVFSSDGRVVTCNASAARMLRRSEAELRADESGCTTWDLLREDGSKLAIDEHPALRVLATGVARHQEVIGLRFGDEIVWVLNNAEPQIDPTTGAITGVIASFADITAQRRSEHRLAAERARFAAIIDALTQGVLVLSASGEITHWNPALARLMDAGVIGVPERRDEIARRGLLLEDGSRLAPEDFPARRTLRTGEIVRDAVLGMPLDDRIAWMRTNSVPVFDPQTGAIDAVVLSFEDITERRRVERALADSRADLASIFQAIHEGVVVFGPGGEVLSCNPSAEKILRRSAAELTRGTAFLALGRATVREDGSPFPVDERPIRRALRTGLPQRDVIAGIVDVAGIIWVLVNAEPIVDAQTGEVRAAVASFTDITNRRRRENELAESRARIESIVSSAMDAIISVDEDQRILLFNAAAERMFGCTAEEIRGRPLETFVPIRDRERHGAHFRAFAKMPASVRDMRRNMTVMARRLDGTEFPIEASISRVDVGGRPLFTVIHRDITARLAAERTDARLAALVRSSPAAIIATSADGIIETWNDAATALFGYGADEAIGRPVTMLAVSDDATEVRTIFQRVLAGEMFKAETVRRHADGSVVEVWISVAPILDPAGRVVGAAAVMSDIGERKRNERLLRERERELRQTLDAAGLGVWWVDVASGLLHCDSRSRVLFAAAEVLPLGQVAERFEGADRTAFIELMAGTIDPVLRNGLELKAHNLDGTNAWLSLTARLRTADHGGVEIWGTVRDVTERRTAEQALKQFESSRRLEALGRMTGGIAHDFNNLLTVISGNLQLLDMAPEKEAAARYVAEALRATETGAQLNNRLTTFARQRRLEPVTTDLNDRIGAMIDLLNRTVGSDIVVSAYLAPDLAKVRVDPSEIENAVLNLAFNARDAMPHGGRIVIETRNVVVDETPIRADQGAHAGPYVRLSVSDTGAGMSDEVKARAFEPFFTTKDFGQGTGLGLATLHGFVRQSGGFVTLYSEPGHGTTVHIHLPCADLDDATTATLRGGAPIRGDGETILVVEDNAGVGRVTRERLIALGYHVIEAVDGPSALTALAAGGTIDLIFSDIMMPGGLSGIDLARRIRKTAPHRRILLTTGFAEEIARGDHRAAALEFRVLRKPYSLGDLSRSIAEALHGDPLPASPDAGAAGDETQT